MNDDKPTKTFATHISDLKIGERFTIINSPANKELNKPQYWLPNMSELSSAVWTLDELADKRFRESKEMPYICNGWKMPNFQIEKL